jgi:hypothetical protein
VVAEVARLPVPTLGLMALSPGNDLLSMKPRFGANSLPYTHRRCWIKPLNLAARHGRSKSLWPLASAMLAGTLLVSGCAASGPAASPPPSSSTQSTSAASSKAIAKAEDACNHRPDASGDIYVRMVQPGQAPVAQELGGSWVWNVSLNKCLTSVRMIIATAPRTAVNCTQVGYVAGNPGYDPNANVAAPLKHVVAQAGPAC